jgi:hypothetical protein
MNAVHLDVRHAWDSRENAVLQNAFHGDLET